MRKTMFVLGGLVCATWLSAQDYQKTAYGIKAAAGGVDVEVQFFTPSVVRVVKSPQGEHFEKKEPGGRWPPRRARSGSRSVSRMVPS